MPHYTTLHTIKYIPPQDSVRLDTAPQNTVGWGNFAFFSDSSKTEKAAAETLQTTTKKSVAVKPEKKIVTYKAPVKKNTETSHPDSLQHAKTFYNSFRFREDYTYPATHNSLKPEEGKQFTLNPTEITPVKNLKDSENFWVLGFFFIIAAGLIRLRYFNFKHVGLYFRSMTNFQLGNKIYRDNNTITGKISSLMNALFILSFSIFIYLTFKDLPLIQATQYPIMNFFIILGLFSSLILFRVILLKFLGWIFKNPSIANEYLFNILLTWKIAGIVFIPLIILEFYLPERAGSVIPNIGLGVLTIMIIIRFLKGIKIILRTNILLLYIVLYLCTLEILPLAILIKEIISITTPGA